MLDPGIKRPTHYEVFRQLRYTELNEREVSHRYSKKEKYRYSL